MFFLYHVSFEANRDNLLKKKKQLSFYTRLHKYTHIQTYTQRVKINVLLLKLKFRSVEFIHFCFFYLNKNILGCIIYICIAIVMADTHCCMAETNTTL